LKWLADENISSLVVRILRDHGDDVLYAKEKGLTGATDEDLLTLAERQSRVIITRDKDLPSLGLLARRGFFAVLLLRLKSPYPDDAADVIRSVLARNIEFDSGTIVVANERRIRVSSLPLIDGPDR